MDTPPLGQVITFYSYKGGTGRTMALANVACLIGRGGGTDGETAAHTPRVLAIDWDFEAPGLHRYFRPYLRKEAMRRQEDAPGCLDIFMALDQERSKYDPTDFVGNRRRAREELDNLSLDAYLLSTRIAGLSIMKAGQFGSDYAQQVSNFQWDRLFRDTIGLFSGFTDFLRQRFDYILVDSRTGINDTSGICTMLLPDKLVVVFTPNEQSLAGVEDLVRKAVAYRKGSPDGRSLTVFPLPSRIEMARPELRDLWRHGGGDDLVDTGVLAEGQTGYQPLFERLFDEIYARNCAPLDDYFNEVILPHIPDYAYGEPIAVLLERGEPSISLSARFAAFTERLMCLRAPWESLAQVRLEAGLRKRCEDTVAKVKQGALEEAASLAYGLMEPPPPLALLEQVVKTVLVTARETYAIDRRTAGGALVVQAAKLLSGKTEAQPTLVAGLLSEAGDVCLAAGDYSLAQELFEECRERFAKDSTEEHPAALLVEGKLAQALLGQGKRATARELQTEVLDAYQRLLGEEHPDALRAKKDLVSMLWDAQDHEGALALQEQVLETSRRLLGEEHPQTLAAMSDLARQASAQGDATRAQQIQEKVLELKLSLLGEEHPQTLRAMSALSGYLADTGDLEGALGLEKKVLDLSQRALGHEHLVTRFARSKLLQLSIMDAINGDNRNRERR